MPARVRTTVISSLIAAALLALASLAWETAAKAEYAVETVATHARALNWLTGAVEEMARRMNAPLPPRPIVPESE